MSLKPILVVGTSAPFRRASATDHFGEHYEVISISPDIDEKAHRSDNAYDLTRAVAKAKLAEVVSLVAKNASLAADIASRPGSAAITFDQVVVWNNEIREKPVSVAELRHFIKCYSNSHLDTVQTTAVHLFDSATESTAHNLTTTYYRELPDDVVERVVQRGHGMHTAGGFTVEDEDMKAHMIRIDPGTEEEVKGFCVSSAAQLLGCNPRR